MKRFVWLTTVLMLVLVLVTAVYNRADLAEKKEAQENAHLIVKKEGSEVKKLAMVEITSLGETEFPAEIRSSSRPTSKHTFAGVPLKNIFSAAEVEITPNSKVIVQAVDGYAVALTGQEVLADENVYLAYRKDGKLLGSKESGGSGPYQLVILQDEFSQRWCKFVVEVDIE